jgi:hypothetical protein
MGKTKHPCAKLSKATRDCFEQIATGNALPRSSKRAFEILSALGLIQQLEDKVLGRDVFGLIVIPQYQVPIPIHAQFCQWASENFKEED